MINNKNIINKNAKGKDVTFSLDCKFNPSNPNPKAKRFFLKNLP